jgi:hypothetical protein
MKRILTLLICIPLISLAQFPEDALRYGYPVMSGTARNLAIGGAGGSLGGDITSAHINPAGIGLYKNSEIVLSPAFQYGNFKYDYLNENTASKNNNFLYGTSGFVAGSPNSRNRKATSSAFSISVNQIANYNNTVMYQGQNNQSSWSEQYVEQLVRDRATMRQAEENYITGASLAFWTFLVDTLSDASGNVVGYQSLVPLSANGSQFINQINQIETRGGEHEISLAFANNYNDKFYLGGSVNFPIYSYHKDQVYREKDESGDANNDFDFFEYRETARTTGFGLNAKLGMIVKPVERLRLGLAFHTPTIAGMTDTYTASITTNTEQYTIFSQPITETSQNLAIQNQTNGSGNPDNGIYEYNLTTPYRIIGSASFVINEVRDVKRQKGFITADIEYVNHRGTRFNAINAGDEGYYEGLNNVIKDNYKGALNFKVGGELKFEKIMARAGFSSFGSPYSSQTGLKTKRTMLSGGVGYRHRGMFVDLTYVHAFIGSIHIPYFLEDKPNPLADGTNNKGALMLTVGFKL